MTNLSNLDKGTMLYKKRCNKKQAESLPYSEAFALTRLAERIGLNLGIFLGGLVIARLGEKNFETYSGLYLLDSFTFLFFFLAIYFGLPSTRTFEKQPLLRGWAIALKDCYSISY